MKNLWMIKRGTALVPGNEETADRLKKVKQGKMCRVDVVVPRNQEFHNKFFVLLHFGYDYWEPELERRGNLEVVKSFDRYREEILIMAGHRDVVASVRGDVRYQAKSVSLGSIGEEEFERLYKAVFQVIWDSILKIIPGMTEDEANNALSIAESFT